jgi:DNA replication protein DnaC
MNSPAPKTTPTTPTNSLSSQLQQIGLCALPTQLDDFIARATKSRWSAHQILEQLVQAEGAERSRRSLERRLRMSGIKSFKPMADFDWSWPAKIERDVIERALSLDFLGEARNLVMVGRNGLGKTMIAQNLCHAAVLAGHSVLFRSAAALLEDLHRQTPEGRRRKLRTYANVGLLAIDEVGYLSFDDKAADLLYEVVNRRYERKPVILTTNRPFKEWNEVFPNATCIVTLLDRLLHHAEVTVIEGDSYRVREVSGKPRRAGGRNDPCGRRKSGLCRCSPDPVSGSARYAGTAQPGGSVARQQTSPAGGALAAGGVRLAARHATTALQACRPPAASEDSFPCLFPAGHCRATAAVIARRIPRLLAPQTSQAGPGVTAGRMFKTLRFLVIANSPIQSGKEFLAGDSSALLRQDFQFEFQPTHSVHLVPHPRYSEVQSEVQLSSLGAFWGKRVLWDELRVYSSPLAQSLPRIPLEWRLAACFEEAAPARVCVGATPRRASEACLYRRCRLPPT